MRCSGEHRVLCSTLKGVQQQDGCCWLWLIGCGHNCRDLVSVRHTFPIFTFARSDPPHSIDACTSLQALLVETHFWFRNHTSACVRISHWRLTRVFVLSLGIAIRRIPQCGAVRYRLQVIKNFPASFSQSKSNLLEGKMCDVWVTFLVYNFHDWILEINL